MAGAHNHGTVRSFATFGTTGGYEYGLAYNSAEAVNKYRVTSIDGDHSHTFTTVAAGAGQAMSLMQPVGAFPFAVRF